MAAHARYFLATSLRNQLALEYPQATRGLLDTMATAASLASASHGAGRLLSRTRAKAELGEAEVRRHLADYGVELIGGGLDEAPMAYKDIRTVMASQRELVDVLGSFTPKIVRMDGA